MLEDIKSALMSLYPQYKVINIKEFNYNNENYINFYFEEKRLSTVETNVKCKFMDNQFIACGGDEIGYGDWYDLDKYDLEYFSNIINRAYKEME